MGRRVRRRRHHARAPRRRTSRRAAWDDQTLAGPGRAITRRRARRRRRGRRRGAVGHLRRARAPTPPRLADALAARGVGPGDVVSVQLPNRYETVVVAVAVLSPRRGDQPAAAELPRPRARARLRRPPGRRSSSPRRVPRLRPPRARRPGRGAPPASRPCTWWSTAQAPAPARRATPTCSRRGSPAAALGDRARPTPCRSSSSPRAPRPGPRRSCTPSRPPDFSVRVAVRRPRRHRRRRGVDAVAGRALHRLQLRPALRALPRPAAGAAGPVGRRDGACDLVPGARLHVHARRDDVPAGPRGARPPRRARASTRCGSSAAVVRRCRRALVDAAAAVGIEVLRLYGSTEVLVGTWNRPVVDAGPEARHRRRRHEPRRAAGRRRRRQPCSRPATAGELEVARPEHLRRLLRRPRAHRGHVPPRRVGALRRPRHDRRRRLPHRRRPQEGDHHPRRHQHRAPRDRGAARRLPRGRAGGGGRPARRAPRRAHVRVRRAAPRAPRSTSTRWCDRLDAAGLATYKRPRAARGARRAADHRIGQDPEARDGRALDARARGTVPQVADDDPVLVEHLAVGDTGRTRGADPPQPARDAQPDRQRDARRPRPHPRRRSRPTRSVVRACWSPATGGPSAPAATSRATRRSSATARRSPRFVAELHRMFGRLRALPVPAVALVNGVAVAGGLELILNCDFALVAESARIGDGHLNFGQMGGGGVLTLLPRAIGRARATELMLSGRLLLVGRGGRVGPGQPGRRRRRAARRRPGLRRRGRGEEPARRGQRQGASCTALGRERLGRRRPRRRARARRRVLPRRRTTRPRASPPSPRSARRASRDGDPMSDVSLPRPDARPAQRAVLGRPRRAPGDGAGVPGVRPPPVPAPRRRARTARPRAAPTSRLPAPASSTRSCGCTGRSPPATVDEVPYCVATVDLDGGGRMFGRVEPPEAVEIGLAVQPVVRRPRRLDRAPLRARRLRSNRVRARTACAAPSP